MRRPSCGRGLLAALLCGALRGVPASSGEQGGDGQRRVIEAWLYGNVVKYAYYYVELLVGSPEPQRTSVIVDTGSHLVGFPCRGCTKCGDHIDPAFNFSHSESAEWLNCTTRCDGCDEGTCEYVVNYCEGSGVEGRWFEDVLRFEGPSGLGPPIRAQMGCHFKESNLFLTQRADGIMGLAPRALDWQVNAHRTILKDLFADDDVVKNTVFSLCFSTWGGRLIIGGHDSSYDSGGDGAVADGDAAEGRIQWIKMKADLYYGVFPTGLTLEGLPIGSGEAAFGPTIVDSGTTFSSFPGPLYQNLVNEIKMHCNFGKGCGKDQGHGCWKLPDLLSGPHAFPTLKMQFGMDGEIEWPPHAYMHQHGGMPDVWCYSFEENQEGITSVLGISWMLHKDVIFDLEESRIGVVRTVCPEKGRPESYSEKVSLRHPGLDGRAEALGVPAALRPRRLLPTSAAVGALLVLAALGSTVALALRARRCRWSTSRPEELKGALADSEDSDLG